MDGFVPSASWRQTLESMASRVRAACLAHPQVAVLVATRVSLVRGGVPRGGRGDRRAAPGRLRGPRRRSLLPVAGGHRHGAGAPETRRLSLRSTACPWKGTGWPGVASTWPSPRPGTRTWPSVAPFLAEADEDDQFETTLGLLLDAVELRARAGR